MQLFKSASAKARATSIQLGVLLCAALVGSSASAKELANRLGIGVTTDTSIHLPSLSTIYYPVSDIAITGALGIDTQDDNSKFAFVGGVRRIIFKEEHMNFFMGGEVGLINDEVNSNKQSGFELNGLFGGEFFLQGLDNLGFTFAGGVGVVSLSSVRFRTVAQAPLTAAVTFYF